MNRKLIAGVAGMSLMVAGAGAAVVANGASNVPTTTVVKQKATLSMKPNRYVKDGMRFNKDVYVVKSGGTLKMRLTQPQEGPHSLSVVKKKDLPTTADEAFNHCKPCNQLAEAHGADPNTEGPPQFQYLEDGQGQNEPPNLDKPGDSGITGPNKGDTITFHVTAKPGTTLHFMCIIHAWMQAKVQVK
ncbi:MAG: hypothetical protein QOH38_2223 [Thermoleophilaceae bacterium]|jgi:hypothetical protein|nr:hypothetical protein [Thermoleophilaceae bacterium]MEA2369505.1 hypothetical protein [Thermoleophilaceae bacterium]